MRIVQLIDSLEIGGAEQIAVNYANALLKMNSFSGLVVTRREGNLKEKIGKNVNYLYLNRKRTLDFKAALKLRSYCKKYSVEFIHAHASSFFIAFLVKILYPKLKIIWHDHTGARANQDLKQNKALWFCSKFFSGTIVVNHLLENWCKNHLKIKNVLYLPNFTSLNNERKSTFLQGQKGKRILMLANLRRPKNHSHLLKVAVKIKDSFPEWTFHLVGKDNNDSYSEDLKSAININDLQRTVYIYGSRNDTGHIIEQCDICVLTSTSEGQPMSLLEYGMHRKAVVCTEVGDISKIIKSGINGFTVPSNEVELFSNALVKLIESNDLTLCFGNELYNTVVKNNSYQVIISQYLNWLKNI